VQAQTDSRQTSPVASYSNTSLCIGRFSSPFFILSVQLRTIPVSSVSTEMILGIFQSLRKSPQMVDFFAISSSHHRWTSLWKIDHPLSLLVSSSAFSPQDRWVLTGNFVQLVSLTLIVEEIWDQWAIGNHKIRSFDSSWRNISWIFFGLNIVPLFNGWVVANNFDSIYHKPQNENTCFRCWCTLKPLCCLSISILLKYDIKFFLEQVGNPYGRPSCSQFQAWYSVRFDERYSRFPHYKANTDVVFLIDHS